MDGALEDVTARRGRSGPVPSVGPGRAKRCDGSERIFRRRWGRRRGRGPGGNGEGFGGGRDFPTCFVIGKPSPVPSPPPSARGRPRVVPPQLRRSYHKRDPRESKHCRRSERVLLLSREEGCERAASSDRYRSQPEDLRRRELVLSGVLGVGSEAQGQGRIASSPVATKPSFGGRAAPRCVASEPPRQIETRAYGVRDTGGGL